MTNRVQVQPTEQTDDARRGPGGLVRGGVVVAATVAAVAVWAIGGGHPKVVQGDEVQTVTAVQVAVTSVLAGLAGWALLSVLERNTARPGRIWSIVATVVAVVSLFGPIGAAADTPSGFTLVAMHVVIAAVLIPALAVGARRRRGRG